MDVRDDQLACVVAGRLSAEPQKSPALRRSSAMTSMSCSAASSDSPTSANGAVVERRRRLLGDRRPSVGDPREDGPAVVGVRLADEQPCASSLATAPVTLAGCTCSRSPMRVSGQLAAAAERQQHEHLVAGVAQTERLHDVLEPAQDDLLRAHEADDRRHAAVGPDPAVRAPLAAGLGDEVEACVHASRVGADALAP